MRYFKSPNTHTFVSDRFTNASHSAAILCKEFECVLSCREVKKIMLNITIPMRISDESIDQNGLFKDTLTHFHLMSLPHPDSVFVGRLEDRIHNCSHFYYVAKTKMWTKSDEVHFCKNIVFYMEQLFSHMIISSPTAMLDVGKTSRDAMTLYSRPAIGSIAG